MISRRVQKRLDMEQFHHIGSVFVKEDRETGKVLHKRVNARRARLVSGWVTVVGRVYHLGM